MTDRLNRWTVWKADGNKILLISKTGTRGMIPKGAYLTIEDDDVKFILRVDDSRQSEPFEPSPLISDMNLESLSADCKCKNIVTASRVKTIVSGDEDLVYYIRPLLEARRATQEEIDDAMGADINSKGPKVFVSTIFANENKILRDEGGHMIHIRIPEDFYYYQTVICGKTGSGKTVAMKYLAQNFVEEVGGAVLAINVKEKDLLKMDKPSVTSSSQVIKEWKELGGEAHGIEQFSVFYPKSNSGDRRYRDLEAVSTPISLRVSDMEPEALMGIVKNLSDRAAQALPDIFRAWKNDLRRSKSKIDFKSFLDYMNDGEEDRKYDTMDSVGTKSTITLFPGTLTNMLNALRSASKYFDEDGYMLEADDIMVEGKMSVIDVVADVDFGSLCLRDILSKIVRYKNDVGSKSVPLLIIIDEVHQFYKGDDSKEALGDLALICRTGRAMKMGVIFASQNPSDMPSGISSVVNSKIYFRTDVQGIRDIGSKITADEMEGLGIGFGVASIFGTPKLKVLKFPLSYAGDGCD